MTDNQIVMLMERCYKKEESVVITQFNSDDTITKITVDDILRVIYRKEAEIERLNRDYSTAVETMSNSIRTANADKEALIAGQETLQKALAEKIAEVERLKTLAELGNMRANDYRVMRDRALKAQAEVDRLSQVVLYHDGHIADARAEATEQLSKKIESRLANNTDISNEQYQSIIWDISEACKEMVGESNV